MKIKWYSKGKFTDEEIEDEPYFGPRLKIVKYSYKDDYSYNRYRYWLIDVENKKILINLVRYEVHNGYNDKDITQEEFERWYYKNI